MPPKKRKAASNAPEDNGERIVPRFICRCDEDYAHTSVLECEREQRLIIHRNIVAKASPWSEKIPISVGANQKTFYVDRFLLNLHSGLFRNKFADLEVLHADEQKQFSLPTVDPAMFTEFVCWMTHTRLMPFEAEVIHSNTRHFGVNAWLLGRYLEAPGFQNFIIWEDWRIRCHDENAANPWPSVKSVRFVYGLRDQDTKIKRFMVDLVASKNPFEKYGEEDPEYTWWSDLFKELPELGLDVARSSAKKSNALPWDDARIGGYMEEELDLNQVWKEQMLKDRDLAEIEEDAQNGCIRSIIELDHINREKSLDAEE
ncbi:hypothetical protein N431DRAFT_468935 [Stipitochalara longipes BDJ]|nr:hypothetical protein N431DRAFT_468935 [Stipitochalara longipes BDJ]